MTVPVGGEHVAALRAFLTGDDAFDRISALLDEDDSWQAYGTLAVAAFGMAARRRFPGGYKTDDVIRFVGRTRGALQDEADRIDPRTAERLLRSVLSDPGLCRWPRPRHDGPGHDGDAEGSRHRGRPVRPGSACVPSGKPRCGETASQRARQVLASSAESAGCHSRRTLAAGLHGQWHPRYAHAGAGMLTVAVAVGADDFSRCRHGR
jgi:hypothetical protein